MSTAICTDQLSHYDDYLFDRKKQKSVSFDDDDSSGGMGERVREFLQNLRYFRVFIAMWNIFIIVCMFL